ncbi:hypothetical protein ALNOE001_03570 [Candidatus Methanobinarius endosymbioticus]|uniref:Uncharacterized protein n=1 Tax=Candidatus Methanobinarius endosymbioticus TaxID=2006182 RepID=A0A366MEY6_9EURY|nr:hypothetical protein ALNOE001_03570 [Candidatus Methanobinarius endosymbioticus]
MELYKATELGAGPCTHCKKCNLKSCVNRNLARPSIKACGINAQKTIENNGYETIGNENGEKIFYCYGLLLVK